MENAALQVVGPPYCKSLTPSDLVSEPASAAQRALTLVAHEQNAVALRLTMAGLGSSDYRTGPGRLAMTATANLWRSRDQLTFVSVQRCSQVRLLTVTPNCPPCN